MRQRVSPREHLRRGNAATILIVAGQTPAYLVRDAAQVKELSATLGPAEIAKRLGIARSSVYRALA